ncbi:DinB family protein, partial [Myxococcota bacterium]|nr:DinB family protein [Myxococcota bacterium]
MFQQESVLTNHRTSAISTPARLHLAQEYSAVRTMSETLCHPLEPEDMVPQSMPDTSPTKWHLAHTTWFFEQFVLSEFNENHRPIDPSFRYLFNSYYNGVGPRHARALRGLLSRPSVDEVLNYRAAVDQSVLALLERDDHPKQKEILRVVEIGLHHEQQHQELILTDIKHLFSVNALKPAYGASPAAPSNASPGELGWVPFDEGLYEIGHTKEGFAFDNERPRHRSFCESFSLSDRLITNSEYLEFVEDGGYENPSLWLESGWATVRNEQ